MNFPAPTEWMYFTSWLLWRVGRQHLVLQDPSSMVRNSSTSVLVGIMATPPIQSGHQLTVLPTDTWVMSSHHSDLHDAHQENLRMQGQAPRLWDELKLTEWLAYSVPTQQTPGLFWTSSAHLSALKLQLARPEELSQSRLKHHSGAENTQCLGLPRAPWKIYSSSFPQIGFNLGKVWK